MFIGVLQVELRLPLANSLKDKRSVIKRLLNRLHKDYNLAVAELDHLDRRRSCIMGVVTVCNSKPVAEKTLRRALGLIESTDGLELIEQNVEFL